MWSCFGRWFTSLISPASGKPCRFQTKFASIPVSRDSPLILSQYISFAKLVPNSACEKQGREQYEATKGRKRKEQDR